MADRREERSTTDPVWRMLSGVLVFIIGVYICGSVGSYHPSDPSWNMATDQTAQNLFGDFGAVIADFLRQCLGWASWIAGLGLMVGGARRTCLIGVPNAGRWALGAVSIPLFAGLFASWPVPQKWALSTGLGGIIGESLHNLATIPFQALFFPVPGFLASIVLGGLACLTMWRAAGLRKRHADLLVTAMEWFGSRVLRLGRHSHAKLSDRLERLSAPQQGFALANEVDADVWQPSRFLAQLPEPDEETRIRIGSGGSTAPQAQMEDETESSVIPRASVPQSKMARMGLFVDQVRARFSNVTERLDRQQKLPQNDAVQTREWLADAPAWEEREETPAPPVMETPVTAEPAPIRAPVVDPKIEAVPVKAPTLRVDPDYQPIDIETKVEPLADIPPTVTAPNTLRRKKMTTLPSIDLLNVPPARKGVVDEEALIARAGKLAEVLKDFGVRGRIREVRPGPVVTLFEMEPAPGVKSARIISLADDIARSMSATSARLAVIPGKNAIGIELPNDSRETVYFRTLIESEAFKGNTDALPMALGEDIGGLSTIVNLAKMPHLLIAGTTGSGKSVGVNAMILSLIYRLTPEQCRFIMIDPKMLELSIYEGIPHLLAPVVTDPHKAVNALKWAVCEMESRYELMSKAGVRNLAGFNDKAKKFRERGEPMVKKTQTGFDSFGKPIHETQELPIDHIPNIVIIIDEMADLMMVAGKEIEGCIQRLAQMARAAGIHLITATQRPSVDVITGTIKANFPTRISYMVTTKIDSRTILGEQGAEQLLGMGDLLYQAPGVKTRRLHGPFVSDEEVEQVVTWLKTQGEPDYHPDVLEGPSEGAGSAVMDAILGTPSGDKEEDLYAQGMAIVIGDQRASTSYLQRRLKIGYNKAAGLIDRLEEEGVISAPNHKGKREVLHESAPSQMA